ncbi:MAG: hypothetical protein KAY75_02365, partial [Limnohabitans sp.]|nr:hypothetical protein [Limnohabitans sp.]
AQADAFLLHPFGDLDKSVETGSQSSFAPIYALSTAGNRFISMQEAGTVLPPWRCKKSSLKHTLTGL